jgi:serine/threonine protein kinase
MANNIESKSENAPTDASAELPKHLLHQLQITIPGYKLLNEISRGGQAIVYKAIQLTTGKTVAVKVLLQGPLADQAARERLQREVRVLAALSHPNIVTVIDSGRTPEDHEFLVMNFISGQPLTELMKANGNRNASADDPALLPRLFLKICEAVNAAHLKGVTHRDLSPSNILVDDRGEPHVLDFGLARTAFDRFITDNYHEISITGQFLGKLAYASPEQARGNLERIDIRTDVYALGVILYQILAGGRFPYEVVGNVVDVLNNIIYTHPLPPSKLAAHETSNVEKKLQLKKNQFPLVNETIEAIVLKALEKEPENRYQSAGELAREIARYLSGQPTQARPVIEPPVQQKSPKNPDAPAPKSRVTILPRSWRRVAFVALITIVAGVLAGGGYYVACYEWTLHDIQSHNHVRR